MLLLENIESVRLSTSSHLHRNIIIAMRRVDTLRPLRYCVCFEGVPYLSVIIFEGLPECDRLDKREQRNAALVKPLQVIAVGY